MINKKYDLIAIGAGSGGLATVIKAAQLGARCALIEAKQIGGTCVNLGCVPKKILWLASQTAHTLRHATDYGFQTMPLHLDWQQLTTKRQAYILKAQQAYQQRLQQLQIDYFQGVAQFVTKNTLKVGTMLLKAPHLVIATGSRPQRPEIEGAQLGIDSDGFFQLEALPKRVAIVGAGYIALELSGLLHAFGCDTLLVFRQDKVLRHFDTLVSDHIMQVYQQQGITLKANHSPIALKRHGTKLSLQCANQRNLDDLDAVIWATGRSPNIEALNLATIGLSTHQGAIQVDRFQNSSLSGIYAIGDVSGGALTPVAIAAGRKLAIRLFGSDPNSHLDYSNIPSVIFSHPPIGTVGLSEMQARQQLNDEVKIYQTKFTPMGQSFSSIPIPTVMKLVTSTQGKILGCHIVGDHAEEMLQGFAVAIKMGASKADFDNTVAIHPSSAEELVTLS